MSNQLYNELEKFLDILGLNEEPVGIFYTDNEPTEGFSPKPMPLPTRESHFF